MELWSKIFQRNNLPAYRPITAVMIFWVLSEIFSSLLPGKIGKISDTLLENFQCFNNFYEEFEQNLGEYSNEPRYPY